MNGRLLYRLVSLAAPAVLAGGLAAQDVEEGGRPLAPPQVEELEEGTGALPELDLDLPVSIQALMISMIDPAAHYLWDFATRDDPLTEGQWQAAIDVATQLAAAGPLIRLGGTGEQDQDWTSDRGWIVFAREMQRAALSALQAAERRDRDSFAAAGGRLADACDGCHQSFRPSLQPEGLHEVTPGGLYQPLF